MFENSELSQPLLAVSATSPAPKYEILAFAMRLEATTLFADMSSGRINPVNLMYSLPLFNKSFF